MKLNSLLFLPFALFLLFAASCVDTKTTEEEYASWKGQNEAYFDSYSDSTGYTVFNIPANRGGGMLIYKKVIEGDTSLGSPHFNDTVVVHYKGQLIDGTIFDYTYAGVADFTAPGDTAIWDNNEDPKSFAVNDVVKGWYETLMDMHVGEKRRVIIPWSLGYGETGKSTINPYSTLIFDIKLVSYGTPKSN